MARRRSRAIAILPAMRSTFPLPFFAGTGEGEGEVVGWEDLVQCLRVQLSLRWMMPEFLAVSEMSSQSGRNRCTWSL